jgi:signal transduction histidine kinase/sugar lactone lactonase YvrE
MKSLAPISLSLCLAAAWMHAASLPIRIYSTAQGLAHDHVSRLYRDSRGFLWVCTDEGLSRFDGSQFVNYTVASGLPHIHVNDFLETRSGEYWVATDGGIARFHPDGRPKRFVTSVPPGSPEAQRVNALSEDLDGSILLGTSAGLYSLTQQEGNVRIEQVAVNFPNNVPEGSLVSSLYLDRQGILWASSLSGLYRRDKDGIWTRLTTPDGSNFINTVTEDPEGQLWICTRFSGFGRLKAIQGRNVILDPQLDLKQGLPDHDVREVWFGSDGRRWAATSSGLVDWSNAAHLRILTSGDGLSDDSIYALRQDPSGSLWIGTRRGGVMRMARADWTTFDHSDGLTVSQDEMILETRSGEICVADLSSARRYIRCLERGRFVPYEPMLPPDIVNSPPNSSEMMMQDHLGAWWISAGRGVIRFPGGTNGRGPAQGPAVPVVRDVQATRLFEDSRGDVWMAVARPQGTTGALRWERQTETLRDESESLPQQYSDVRISAFGEDPSGQMWIGLAREGVLLRRHDGRFEQVPNPLAGRINAFWVDDAKRLWIASLEGGLGRIDDAAAASPKVTVITSAQGLSSNEIWCIVEDRFGRIYAGNARGVDRIDPNSGEVQHYSKTDGLVPGDIRSAIRDQHGDLWFLSNRGASRFRPAMDSALPAPIVRITGVRVSGNPLPISELGETELGPVELSARQNSVAIDFGAIDYSTLSNPLYQYRLEGAAGEWSSPGAGSSVTFANMSPGTYKFLVRSTHAVDPSNSTASFTFTILPPLWRRWWFVALIAIGVIAAAYELHRIQLERKLAVERVRSRIAMDLHDDIGASLARMAVISEVMKSNLSPADLDSQLMLNDIAQTSRRLVDGMGDIVWSIDPRHQQLGDTVDRVRDFASGILEPKGIQWQFDAAPRALSVKLSAGQRRQLYLVFKEAIHNIAKHSQARHAFLRLGVEHGSIWAEIEDDGRGIPSGDGHGMGLRSMRSRAADLSGTLEISPATPHGTQITLRFPIRSKDA